MREVRETRSYLVGVSFQSTKSEKNARRKCSLMEYFDGTRAFDLQMLIVHCIGPTPMHPMPSRHNASLNKQVKRVPVRRFRTLRAIVIQTSRRSSFQSTFLPYQAPFCLEILSKRISNKQINTVRSPTCFFPRSLQMYSVGC